MSDQCEYDTFEDNAQTSKFTILLAFANTFNILNIHILDNQTNTFCKAVTSKVLTFLHVI